MINAAAVVECEHWWSSELEELQIFYGACFDAGKWTQHFLNSKHFYDVTAIDIRQQ